MFVLKNRNDLQLSEARLSHSKQLLKNIHPIMLAAFHSLTKIIYSGYNEKTAE